MVDLSKLNKEQYEAVVTTEGYVRVIASPGSGKTRALTHRFAYLLDDKNISADNILCITYTNKAANEMKERIIKLVNNNTHSFDNISTIHSYCTKLLRQNINLLKGSTKNDFDIYDEYDEEKLIEKIKNYDNSIDCIKTKDLVRMFSALKAENPSYIEFLFGKLNDFSFGFDWADDLLGICKLNNALLFDDLIYGTLYLLEKCEGIRETEQRKFKYIMVDEFQDTTPNTYELVKLLSNYHKNLFIVGDPDQSIYEFIGANPNILLEQFEEDFPSTKTLLMNTNYRSTNRIIDLSNQLISNNVNRFEYKKTIGFSNIEGNKVVYSHYDEKKQQLYNVCRIIEHLHSKMKYKYKDIFLIARNNYSFIDLKRQLISNGIPYVNSRTTSKLGSKEEIKLITYYLSFALNQSSFALYNINEIADLGINKIDMEEVLNVNTDPINFLENHKTESVEKFLHSIERIKSAILSNVKKTSEIIEMIVGEFGILSRYNPDPDSGYFKEGERISSLIQSVIYNEKIDPNFSVFNFLDSIALESSIESENRDDGVILLTAHGSKGLEAKNVIIFDYNSISKRESERRLSYVAFTRAKENLFVLSAGKKGESSFAGEFKSLCINVDKYFENMKLIGNVYDIDKEISDLNEEKKKAFGILTSGANVFLTGEAGTGKTYLINKYVDYLYKNNKNFMICAPTGIAAANYNGGITIHKAFEIPLVPSIISLNTSVSTAGIDKVDTIIIDEISMCRIDIFSYIMRTIRKCNRHREKPIQVILCGDFFQLPPVILDSEKEILKQLFPRYKEGFAFESEEWEKGHFINVVLKEIYRQKDDKFITALNNARKGIDIENAINYINNNCSKVPIENAMEIHSRNVMVNKINTDMLNKLPTKEFIYKASYEGVISSDVNIEDEIHLKPGCRVMMLANEKKLRYQNGSLGTVLTCGENYIDVMTDKNKDVVRIYRKEFDYVDNPILNSNGSILQNIIGSITQLPVRLAYAITIHKSQGQTYDKVNLDPSGWENGQVYVAISRIKGIEGLYLYKEIDKDVLKTSDNVIGFYDKILNS